MDNETYFRDNKTVRFLSIFTSQCCFTVASIVHGFIPFARRGPAQAGSCLTKVNSLRPHKYQGAH
jgi:hypothetical protein